MSYTAHFNEISAVQANRVNIAVEPVTPEARHKSEQQEREKISAKGASRETGLIDLNTAPDDELRGPDRDRKKKAKESEAFQRQLMLQRMLEDMQAMLDDINEAIAATDKVKGLIKKKELDVNNLDHLELLLIAGIDPKLAENVELTETFMDQHQKQLNEQKVRTEQNIESANDLYRRFKENPDDSAIIQEIKDLQNTKEGKFKTYSVFAASGSDNEIKDSIATIANNKHSSQISSSNDISWDEDESHIQVASAKSPASAVYGNSFDAPNVKEQFAAASSPNSMVQPLEAKISVLPIVSVVKNSLG